ncbi:uncharacterized protein LOC103705400 [Phoenix dactylifera]|uniref:Uncharacterized protein LOC103705400 n=1 Tax=Phoenix dactylifera TaxID=42345 RepID=A0A8B7BXE2_PHODC|nr:uncharacterized protein LOC103705400 [Phoenix dactylifera]
MEKKCRPLIVAMKGHPGTGKSTLARDVAAALRCPLLDKDDVRDCTLPVQQSLAAATSSAGGAAALLNDLSYSVLWRMAETQLRLGLTVVVDSPLSRRTHLDRLLHLARRAGAGVVVVECRPSDEAEWRRRLESRGAAASADDGGWHKPASWAELRSLVEGYGGCTVYDVGDVPRLVVDTTLAAAGAEEVSAAVVEFIRSNAHG